MIGAWRQFGFAVLATVALSFGAAAQEYCVSCSEPNATYRCVIDNPRPGVTPSLQVHCLTVLAREGGHSQCTVRRGVTVFDCDGPVKRVALPADGAPAAALPGAEAAAPAQPAPPAPQGEPKTLAEMAQRAKDASDRQWKQAGDQVKNAGQATGEFFKKTFNCIGSLFTKCNSD